MIKQYSKTTPSIRDIKNNALRQAAFSITAALDNNREAYKVRVNINDNGEIIKISTHSTDNQVRLSVMNNNPSNVHIRFMVFKSVITSKEKAGWSTASITDYWVSSGDVFLNNELDMLSKHCLTWLFVNEKNAVKPRTSFLTKDNTDVAVSAFIAATFVIEHVQVSSTPQLSITLSNKTHGCSVVLKQEIAILFNAPASMVGCRVVIHECGVIRVLRQSVFGVLYSLSS